MCVACTLLAVLVHATAQTPLGTGFTYQGELQQAGPPFNGPANLVFRLCDATGGRPGVKVCWQITGTRKDPYAVDRPFQPVHEKAGRDRGRYYTPQGYGQPLEKQVDRLDNETPHPPDEGGDR